MSITNVPAIPHPDGVLVAAYERDQEIAAVRRARRFEIAYQWATFVTDDGTSLLVVAYQPLDDARWIAVGPSRSSRSDADADAVFWSQTGYTTKVRNVAPDGADPEYVATVTGRA